MDVGFDAADVGDDGVFAEKGRELFQIFDIFLHRSAQENKVKPALRFRRWSRR